MMRILLRTGLIGCLIYLLLLPTPTQAQLYELDITVSPEQPTPGDTITITVDGWWFDSCVPNYSSHIVTSGCIGIHTQRLPGGCLAVITPFAFDVEIPPLPQGIYYIFVYGFADGQSRFAVLDPESLVNHSYLPVATR